VAGEVIRGALDLQRALIALRRSTQGPDWLLERTGFQLSSLLSHRAITGCAGRVATSLSAEGACPPILQSNLEGSIHRINVLF
jgi:hypothetical protein